MVRAQAAITALLSLGYVKVAAGEVVVPREPTEAMIKAASNAYGDNWFPPAAAYRAMISAVETNP